MSHSLRNPLVAFARMNTHVLGCMLYGSAARGESTARSDLDLILHVSPDSGALVMTALSVATFSEVQSRFQVRDPSKVILYAHGLKAKAEVLVVDDLAVAARFVIGSRIRTPESAVLLDKTGALVRWARELPDEHSDREEAIREQLIAFPLEFEAGSSYHAGSDAFRAHRRLGQAFSRLAKLAWLATGGEGFLFSPRQLFSRLEPELRRQFEGFENVPSNAKLYSTKRQLVAILRSLLRHLDRSEPALLSFVEEVMARDQFWNHRDSADFVAPNLRRGVLFRGCSPQFHGGEPEYAGWYASRGVRTRIDLRGVQEREEAPLPELGLNTVLLPMEPGASYDRTDPLLQGEDSYERGCRIHVFRRGDVIRGAAEVVAAPGSVVFVHCKAGRDRTGVTIASLQYLVGVPVDGILNGFSLHANAADTRSLGRALRALDEAGGPAALASRSGISPALLAALRVRLLEPR